ncbi:hypothetical protein [Serinibacter arcticus]|uniref:Uncharacterized protein n=1 Tax=Serinibacter arcticus TaxID=1655435 RepID=A0A4Z1DYE7_9MICO|nr:hypothetical protein [Serinibacter arcticus]TGO04050.1 hypothetical protein SERN_2641 [Serinibacter arcticus]
MRWQELFDDLESQAEAEDRWREEEEVAELGEAERGRILLADRLRGCVGHRLVVGVDGGSHTGTVIEATRSWCVLRTDVRDVLVPSGAIRWVDGAGRTAPDPGAAESRLSLAHVLRRLASQEVPVRVVVAGRTVVGRVEAVGLDHLEVAQDDGTTIAVPFPAVTSVAL